MPNSKWNRFKRWKYLQNIYLKNRTSDLLWFQCRSTEFSVKAKQTINRNENKKAQLICYSILNMPKHKCIKFSILTHLFYRLKYKLDSLQCQNFNINANMQTQFIFYARISTLTSKYKCSHFVTTNISFTEKIQTYSTFDSKIAILEPDMYNKLTSVRCRKFACNFKMISYVSVNARISNPVSKYEFIRLSVQTIVFSTKIQNIFMLTYWLQCQNANLFRNQCQNIDCSAKLQMFFDWYKLMYFNVKLRIF